MKYDDCSRNIFEYLMRNISNIIETKSTN